MAASAESVRTGDVAELVGLAQRLQAEGRLPALRLHAAQRQSVMALAREMDRQRRRRLVLNWGLWPMAAAALLVLGFWLGDQTGATSCWLAKPHGLAAQSLGSASTSTRCIDTQARAFQASIGPGGACGLAAASSGPSREFGGCKHGPGASAPRHQAFKAHPAGSEILSPRRPKCGCPPS